MSLFWGPSQVQQLSEDMFETSLVLKPWLLTFFALKLKVRGRSFCGRTSQSRVWSFSTSTCQRPAILMIEKSITNRPN